MNIQSTLEKTHHFGALLWRGQWTILSRHVAIISLARICCLCYQQDRKNAFLVATQHLRKELVSGGGKKEKGCHRNFPAIALQHYTAKKAWEIGLNICGEIGNCYIDGINIPDIEASTGALDNNRKFILSTRSQEGLLQIVVDEIQYMESWSRLSDFSTMSEVLRPHHIRVYVLCLTATAPTYLVPTFLRRVGESPNSLNIIRKRSARSNMTFAVNLCPEGATNEGDYMIWAINRIVNELAVFKPRNKTVIIVIKKIDCSHSDIASTMCVLGAYSSPYSHSGTYVWACIH